MQEFLKQCGFIVLSLLVLIIIRQAKGEMQIPVKLVVIVVLFGVCLTVIEGVIAGVNELSSYSGASKYVSIMLKALFIGIITTICSSLCTDAGEGTLSYICTLVGKAQLLALALPLIFEVLEMAISLVGEV